MDTMFLHSIPDRGLRNALIAAKQCDRRPVSLAWLYHHPDLTGYYFSFDNAAMGLDPWGTITGVDFLTDENKYVLECGAYHEKILPADYIVYVDLKKGADNVPD